MDNMKYMDIFIEESKEHLQTLNENILELEKDNDNIDLVNEIFRAAHTLKGMAGTMGFNTIMKLTHGMENALDEVRNGKRQITPDMIDMLFNGVDLLETLIKNVEDTDQEGEVDIEHLLNRFKGKKESKQNVKSQLNAHKINNFSLDQYQRNILITGIKKGLNSYWINIILRRSCVLKSARAYIIFRTLEKLGEIIKTNPSVQDIEEEKFDFSIDIVILSSSDRDELEQKLGNISEIETIEIKQLNEQMIENLSNSDTNSKQQTSSNSNNNKSGKEDKKENKARKSRGSIRVDIEKLDVLMNLVSELIIIKNRIQGICEYQNDSEVVESIEYLTRVTTELHDAVTKVRMVPVEMVFNRFPRVVRDLARDTGKKVKLNISGAETEVDRTIVDEIGDPIIHLLRNAIDHGLEPPQERIKAHKSEVGNVDLLAYHDGNNVIIEIRDDGRGIDVEAVARKALDRGLIDQNKLDTLEYREIMDFMFQPGFSTAKKVSNISGRGVGLDVVRTKVESLGGTVEIDTKKGLGTRFIIRLPLTLSIIEALLIKIGQEIYAIPLNSTQEIIDFAHSDIQDVAGQKVVSYRGKLIPLINLHEELEVQEYESQNEDTITAVVVKKGDKLSALSIDDLVGQQEIVIKSLGKYLSNIKIISGATILGDGRVALILDTNRLI